MGDSNIDTKLMWLQFVVLGKSGSVVIFIDDEITKLND